MIKTFLLTLLVFTLIQAKTYTFDTDALGNLSKEWHCSQVQGQVWNITQEKKSSHLLTLLQTNASGNHFNTCYVKSHFLDGEIQVKLKANSGRGDQGGGIIWRVQDTNNYYIVRYNPLEDNFTFYKVIDSYRHQLQNVNVALQRAGWHTLKVIQKKAHYQIYLDGSLRLEGDDSTFTNAGGVGVWSKADALSSFDDLVVRP